MSAKSLQRGIGFTCLLAVACGVTSGDENELSTESARATACSALRPITIRASAVEGSNGPANAVDGDLTTRWSASGMRSWIVLDFGTRQAISSLKIAWYRGDERIIKYLIGTSTDGNSFTQIATGQSSGTTASYETAAIPATNTRYLLIMVTGNSQGDFASISDVSVCGSSTSTSSDAGTTDSSTNTHTNNVDRFGVKEIYPTKDGREWYVNMDNPTSDPRFRNLPPMTRQSDGSWQVNKDQVRMEAWSPDNQKWLNVEITEYAKVLQTADPVLQMYSRGGHHSTSRPCEGSAYKSRLYLNGQAAFVKELCHPAYAGDRGVVTATSHNLIGKWVGHKAVIRNVTSNGMTFVRLESYIDEDVTDAHGNLVVKNDWRLASVYEDKDTTWTSNDYSSDCHGCAYKNGEIMTGPGGTATANLAAWRSDKQTWNWKYLSVREIQVP